MARFVVGNKKVIQVEMVQKLSKVQDAVHGDFTMKVRQVENIKGIYVLVSHQVYEADETNFQRTYAKTFVAVVMI